MRFRAIVDPLGHATPYDRLEGLAEEGLGPHWLEPRKRHSRARRRMSGVGRSQHHVTLVG